MNSLSSATIQVATRSLSCLTLRVSTSASIWRLRDSRMAWVCVSPSSCSIDWRVSSLVRSNSLLSSCCLLRTSSISNWSLRFLCSIQSLFSAIQFINMMDFMKLQETLGTEKISIRTSRCQFPISVPNFIQSQQLKSMFLFVGQAIRAGGLGLQEPLDFISLRKKCPGPQGIWKDASKQSNHAFPGIITVASSIVRHLCLFENNVIQISFFLSISSLSLCSKFSSLLLSSPSLSAASYATSELMEPELFCSSFWKLLSCICCSICFLSYSVDSSWCLLWASRALLCWISLLMHQMVAFSLNTSIFIMEYQKLRKYTHYAHVCICISFCSTSSLYAALSFSLSISSVLFISSLSLFRSSSTSRILAACLSCSCCRLTLCTAPTKSSTSWRWRSWVSLSLRRWSSIWRVMQASSSSCWGEHTN